MNNIGDILKNRQAHFSDEERQMMAFKSYLDEKFGAGKCGVRLQHGQVLLLAKTSAFAAHLRPQIPALTDEARRCFADDGLRLRITIGS
jgi:hypothetical protein